MNVVPDGEQQWTRPGPLQGDEARLTRCGLSEVMADWADIPVGPSGR